MLAAKQAMATIAVKDLEKAKKFYGGTLGVKQTGAQDGEAVTYRSGSSEIVVYRSQFAGTNKATSATWGVGDELEQIVSTLKKAGVPFEHYDMPGMTLDGDIHRFGEFGAAGSRTPTATSCTSTTADAHPPREAGRSGGRGAGH